MCTHNVLSITHDGERGTYRNQPWVTDDAALMDLLNVEWWISFPVTSDH